MRKRAALVIFEEGHLALIKRVRKGKTYFVFPGGGIEEDETPPEAAIREALEELGVHVEIGHCIFEWKGENHEYYFTAAIQSGQFGSGTGEEFTDPNRNRGSYEAIWLPVGRLMTISLYPEEIDINELLEIAGVDYREKGIVD